MVSGQPPEDYRERAGVRECLAKPVDTRLLLEILARELAVGAG